MIIMYLIFLTKLIFSNDTQKSRCSGLVKAVHCLHRVDKPWNCRWNSTSGYISDEKKMAAPLQMSCWCLRCSFGKCIVISRRKDTFLILYTKWGNIFEVKWKVLRWESLLDGYFSGWLAVSSFVHIIRVRLNCENIDINFLRLIVCFLLLFF